MATIKYVLETSDLGRLIRGETIDLAQRKGNIRGFELELIDNPTNGDMIKAMFPSVEIHQSGGYTSCLFQPSVMLEDTKSDWWNAPYKESEGVNENS